MNNTLNFSGIKAAVLENNPKNIRLWNKALQNYQLEYEFATSSDEFKNILNKGSFKLLFINKLLIKNLEKNDLAILDSQVVLYPKNIKTHLKLDKKNTYQLDWPADETEFKNTMQSIYEKIANASNQLSATDSIVTLLRPYLIFRSNIMKEGLSLIPKFAQTNLNVLITGQTGTGKEAVAKAIHFLSKKNKDNFVEINCGALPENLVESELFGYEKGAFTGAIQKRIGKFQSASGGTLFLDEIGELPLATQVKFLKAIEDKRITPIGADYSIDVDPRIIAATNNDLNEAVKNGTFREDLFYRLNILSINLPPLKDRKDDIALLAFYFLQEAVKELNLPEPYPYFDQPAISLLESQDWPGNVRQLKNFILKLTASLPANKNIIGPVDILKITTQSNSSDLQDNKSIDQLTIPLGTTIEAAKEMMVAFALQKTGGKMTKAAKLLGISPRHLSRMKKKSING